MSVLGAPAGSEVHLELGESGRELIGPVELRPLDEARLAPKVGIEHAPRAAPQGRERAVVLILVDDLKLMSARECRSEVIERLVAGRAACVSGNGGTCLHFRRLVTKWTPVRNGWGWRCGRWLEKADGHRPLRPMPVVV